MQEMFPFIALFLIAGCGFMLERVAKLLADMKSDLAQIREHLVYRFIK